MGRIVGRTLAVAVSVVAVVAGLTATGRAAGNQTFDRLRAPTTPATSSAASTGVVLAKRPSPVNGSVRTTNGIDLSITASSCEASEVTLQLVRG